MKIGLILYVGGLLSVCLSIKTILTIFLSLEFMIVRLFFVILITGVVNLEFMVFYIVISVCEAVLGIGILILGIMVEGDSYYKRLDLIK
jgi:NADH:ubiquinone oxidoreductase subunit K